MVPFSFWLNGIDPMKKLNSLLLFSILFSTQIFASSSKIKTALEDFKKGSYQRVIKNIKNINGNNNILKTKNYLLALSYNRVQEFDLAINHFKKTLRLGQDAKDVYYEFGQALYANNDLGKSRTAFKKSYERNYKKDSSLYYMGHISQILEQPKRAKSYYVKLVKSKTADINLVQVGRFQLAEVLLTMARGNSEDRRLVKKFVLPQMDKALKVDESSSLAPEIYARKKEIEREFGLDPNILYNGRRVNSKRWNASISQKFVYDNNISLTSDLPSAAATLEDSFIFRTNISADYNWILKKKYIIKPVLDYEFKKHTNRDSEPIKTQDSFDVTPGLRNSFEHKLFNNPASLLFDITYNYSGRYRVDTDSRSFYSRYLNFSFGEKFKFFSKGETSFKIKFKDLKSNTKDQDSKTTSFSFDQVYLTLRGNIVLFLFSYDAMDTYNKTSSSTNTSLFRFDFINPTLLPNINLHLGMSMSFIDYVDAAESTSRGVEKTFTPMIKLTKKVTKKLKFSVSYEYTKNTSLKEDYKYTKHVTTSALKYNF
jgi:tetratricopeptide (TPR) repeat protein